jgi:hypothetical protein
VLYFLYGAQSPLQADVVCKINAACAALSDEFANLVAAAQRLPFPERMGHLFSLAVVSKANFAACHRLCVGDVSACIVLKEKQDAQNSTFLLYYKRLFYYYSRQL